MKLSKPVAILIAVVVVVAAVAAVIVLSTPQEEQADVRIGYLTGDLHQLSRVVMMDTTLFNGTSLLEQYGVTAVAGNAGGYSAGGAVMDAFAANAIDMAWLGSPPAIQKALNAGTDITIVAVANNEGSSIIAKGDINEISDLGGKTVATPGPSSIQHLLFLEVAKDAGLNVVQKSGDPIDSNTVQWVQIAPKDQQSALSSGQIDAAVGWEPYGSDSILSGTAHIVEWSSEVWPNHPCCVLAVKTSFLNENRDVVEKVLAAHIAANEWIENATADTSSANYTALVGVGASFSARSDDVVKSALNHTKFTYTIDDEFKAQLVNFTNAYIDLGLISDSKVSERGYSSVADFIDHLVDDSYLGNATAVKPVDA